MSAAKTGALITMSATLPSKIFFIASPPRPSFQDKVTLTHPSAVGCLIPATVGTIQRSSTENSGVAAAGADQIDTGQLFRRS
jgi:hypothetical protein